MAAERPTMSQVAGSGAAGGSAKISTVRLDGLAVLKIIKHCRESLPTFVAGSMLGLALDNTLEITNSFPFPDSTDDHEGEGQSGTDYVTEMLVAMRDVNVDHNQVGWYQSTYMGNFCTQELISTQYQFQENLGDNAVVILYDPLRTTHGSFSLKAYRLTEKFMEMYKVEKFLLPNSDKGSPLPSSEIFEEVPIRIHNPPLSRALLLELQDKHIATPVDFNRLDLSTDAFLERKMMSLIEQVEDLADWQHYASRWERKLRQQRQQQAQWIARRKEQNEERKSRGLDPLPETADPREVACFRPLADAMRIDRLDSLLITAQIASYCQEVNNFAGQSFSKLFLAGKLNEGARSRA